MDPGGRSPPRRSVIETPPSVASLSFRRAAKLRGEDCSVLVTMQEDEEDETIDVIKEDLYSIRSSSGYGSTAIVDRRDHDDGKNAEDHEHDLSQGTTSHRIINMHGGTSTSGHHILLRKLSSSQPEQGQTILLGHCDNVDSSDDGSNNNEEHGLLPSEFQLAVKENLHRYYLENDKERAVLNVAHDMTRNKGYTFLARSTSKDEGNPFRCTVLLSPNDDANHDDDDVAVDGRVVSEWIEKAFLSYEVTAEQRTEKDIVVPGRIAGMNLSCPGLAPIVFRHLRTCLGDNNLDGSFDEANKVDIQLVIDDLVSQGHRFLRFVRERDSFFVLDHRRVHVREATKRVRDVVKYLYTRQRTKRQPYFTAIVAAESVDCLRTYKRGNNSNRRDHHPDAAAENNRRRYNTEIGESGNKPKKKRKVRAGRGRPRTSRTQRVSEEGRAGPSDGGKKRATTARRTNPDRGGKASKARKHSKAQRKLYASSSEEKEDYCGRHDDTSSSSRDDDEEPSSNTGRFSNAIRRSDRVQQQSRNNYKESSPADNGCIVYSPTTSGNTTTNSGVMADPRDLCKGSQIAIWWEDDDCYYPGTVEGYRQDERGAKVSFRLAYDDGDYEWLDLRKQAWIPLPAETATETRRPGDRQAASALESSPDSSVVPPPGQGSLTKCTRRCKNTESDVDEDNHKVACSEPGNGSVDQTIVPVKVQETTSLGMQEASIGFVLVSREATFDSIRRSLHSQGVVPTGTNYEFFTNWDWGAMTSAQERLVKLSNLEGLQKQTSVLIRFDEQT